MEVAVSKKTYKMCRLSDEAHSRLEDVRRTTRERNQADALSVLVKFATTPAGAAALSDFCEAGGAK